MTRARPSASSDGVTPGRSTAPTCALPYTPGAPTANVTQAPVSAVSTATEAPNCESGVESAYARTGVNWGKERLV